MDRRVVPFVKDSRLPEVTPEAILAALATPVLAVDRDDVVVYANGAAEQFFDISAAHLVGQPLARALPENGPLFALVGRVRRGAGAVYEHGVTLDSPRTGPHVVNVEGSPLGDGPGSVVLMFRERTIAEAMERQISQRGAARSLDGIAALLAHEVKNPLSGIRGAAQLLERGLGPDDRRLTLLIREEVDRICGLVDRVDLLSAARALRRETVNIHQVLDRVRLLAENGFARHVRFVLDYDPSLPPVHGDPDQLVQALLNLVKNAAEAAPAAGGEVALATSYRHGVRVAVPGRGSRVHLPLAISVADNGGGVPEDLKACLFDPFVTGKRNGSGLGLAFVAKVVDEHGGLVEWESEPGRTVFRILLPAAAGGGTP
jgi:two-component system nitrogen regulation sensor histidine kinase GlnL